MTMAMHGFGITYDDLEYSKKIELLEKELLINEEHYGPDNKKVEITMACLSKAYGSIGDYQKQKELLGQALLIKEKRFGPEHIAVAIALTKLANVYDSLGDYRKQKELLERALLIKETCLGSEHRAMASTLTKLGDSHGKLGNYPKQKELLERALLITEKNYAPNHKEVTIALTNLGNAYGGLGDYQKQKELLERVLRTQEKHYGPEHKEVAIALANLGNAYGSLGYYQKQKGLLERVLRIQEKHYGPEHKEVAIALANLGNAYGSLGDYQKQKKLQERLLLINEKHRGSDHEGVAATPHSLSADQLLEKVSPNTLDLGCEHDNNTAGTSVRQPQAMSSSFFVKKPPGSKTKPGSLLKVKRQIGSGAFGFVFEVVDENECPSALKMVPVISNECKHASGTGNQLHELQRVDHLFTFEFQDKIHVAQRGDESCASTEIGSETQFTTVTSNRKQTNSNSMSEIRTNHHMVNEEKTWIFESAASADSLSVKSDESENECDLDEMEESGNEKKAQREVWFHYLNCANQCPNIVHSIDQWVTENLTKSKFREYRNKMKAILKVKSEDEASSRIKHYANEHSKITVYMLQMHFYPMGNLEHWLTTNKGEFSDTYDDRVCILRGILVGLEYIHCHGVMHRDLCPPNVLLEASNGKIVAKIGDFGTAISCGVIRDWKLTKTRDVHTRNLGTNPYCAPEVDTDLYDKRCDLFSFGMIIVKAMWNADTYGELVRMRHWLLSDETEHFEKYSISLPKAKEWFGLVQRLVTQKPKTRPSCGELLQIYMFS